MLGSRGGHFGSEIRIPSVQVTIPSAIIGYSLCVVSVSDKIKNPEENILYLREIGEENKHIAYTVITPSGKTVRDIPTAILAPDPFNLDTLNCIKEQILEETSKAGHTLKISIQTSAKNRKKTTSREIKIEPGAKETKATQPAVPPPSRPNVRLAAPIGQSSNALTRLYSAVTDEFSFMKTLISQEISQALGPNPKPMKLPQTPAASTPPPIPKTTPAVESTPLPALVPVPESAPTPMTVPVSDESASALATPILQAESQAPKPIEIPNVVVSEPPQPASEPQPAPLAQTPVTDRIPPPASESESTPTTASLNESKGPDDLSTPAPQVMNPSSEPAALAQTPAAISTPPSVPKPEPVPLAQPPVAVNEPLLPVSVPELAPVVKIPDAVNTAPEPSLPTASLSKRQSDSPALPAVTLNPELAPLTVARSTQSPALVPEPESRPTAVPLRHQEQKEEKTKIQHSLVAKQTKTHKAQVPAAPLDLDLVGSFRQRVWLLIRSIGDDTLGQKCGPFKESIQTIQDELLKDGDFIKAQNNLELLIQQLDSPISSSFVKRQKKGDSEFLIEIKNQINDLKTNVQEIAKQNLLNSINEAIVHLIEDILVPELVSQLTEEELKNHRGIKNLQKCPRLGLNTESMGWTEAKKVSRSFPKARECVNTIQVLRRQQEQVKEGKLSPTLIASLPIYEQATEAQEYQKQLLRQINFWNWKESTDLKKAQRLSSETSFFTKWALGLGITLSLSSTIATTLTATFIWGSINAWNPVGWGLLAASILGFMVCCSKGVYEVYKGKARQNEKKDKPQQAEQGKNDLLAAPTTTVNIKPTSGLIREQTAPVIHISLPPAIVKDHKPVPVAPQTQPASAPWYDRNRQANQTTHGETRRTATFGGLLRAFSFLDRSGHTSPQPVCIIDKTRRPPGPRLSPVKEEP